MLENLHSKRKYNRFCFRRMRADISKSTKKRMKIRYQYRRLSGNMAKDLVRGRVGRKEYNRAQHTCLTIKKCPI